MGKISSQWSEEEKKFKKKESSNLSEPLKYEHSNFVSIYSGYMETVSSPNRMLIICLTFLKSIKLL